MKRVFLLLLLCCAALLCSCSKTTTGPHATILLRDGARTSGMILSSDASQIQLSGDDQVTRTIPMTQVQSVSYDASPVAAGAVPQPIDPDHDHYHPPQAAITTTTFEVARGSEISVRLEETIDSGHAAEGQTYPAEVTRDVRDGVGNVVIPRGANAVVAIRSESKGGHFHGASHLVLDLASVSIEGRQYALRTRAIEERGRDGVGANKRTAEFAGGGAAVGAIIGAIAGHGKGAAIGAGSGAGAGALTEILTKGGSIRVPVETVLTFRLSAPLDVVAAQ